MAFDEFFQNTLHPLLVGLEKRRRRIKLLITLLIVIFAPVIVMVLITGTAVLAVVAAFALLFGFHFVKGYIEKLRNKPFKPFYKQYKLDYKNQIIGNIINFFDNAMTYSPEEGFSQEEFENSLLFATFGKTHKSEDLIEGSLGQTDIRIAEVNNHTSGDETYDQIFKGMMIISDFHKNFQGTTLVLPDMAEKNLGRLGQWLQSKNFRRPGELIKLEDPTFEKEFVVYATDQNEARYILTPALMERLVAFQQKAAVSQNRHLKGSPEEKYRTPLGRVNHNKLFVSFHDSKMYLAIPFVKNLFEPPIRKTLLDPSIYQGIHDDLKLAFDVVEDLNLNTKLWSKS